jgi:hypothetical protein
MSREGVLKALEETLGAPTPTRSSASWRGFYAPLGQLSAPMNRDGAQQAWPYRTETAEVVWKHASDLIPKHPEMNEVDVLKKAIEISGVDPLDLSPEDWRLLEMAIEWRKAGAAFQKRPRIGGSTPGGPYDSWDTGHWLPKRGAP